jgi:hypothetical protein
VSAVVVVLLAALLWWLGGDRTRGFGSDLFTVERAQTELGILVRGEGGPITVALDRETVRELLTALETGDGVTATEIGSSPRCLKVSPGTRVRVLQRRKRAVEARVRILDGPWASRIVWVPVAWIR